MDCVSDAVVVVRVVRPGLWVPAIEWGRPPHVPGVIGPAYVVGGRCGRRSVAAQVRKSGGGRRAEGVQGGVIASGPDGPAEGPGTARTSQNGLKTSRKRGDHLITCRTTLYNLKHVKHLAYCYIYTHNTVQKFGVRHFSVSYSHQGWIYLIKNTKQ